MFLLGKPTCLTVHCPDIHDFGFNSAKLLFVFQYDSLDSMDFIFTFWNFVPPKFRWYCTTWFTWWSLKHLRSLGSAGQFRSKGRGKAMVLMKGGKGGKGKGGRGSARGGGGRAETHRRKLLRWLFGWWRGMVVEVSGYSKLFGWVVFGVRMEFLTRRGGRFS